MDEMFGQDLRDDDARVLDEYFEAPDHGPVATDALVSTVEQIVGATRVTYAYTVMNDGTDLSRASRRLLPPDPHRISLKLYSNATGFYWSDQPIRANDFGNFGINSSMNAIYYVPLAADPAPSLKLDAHTGAIWVVCNDEYTTAIAVAVSKVP